MTLYGNVVTTAINFDAAATIKYTCVLCAGVTGGKKGQ